MHVSPGGAVHRAHSRNVRALNTRIDEARGVIDVVSYQTSTIIVSNFSRNQEDWRNKQIFLLYSGHASASSTQSLETYWETQVHKATRTRYLFTRYLSPEERKKPSCTSLNRSWRRVQKRLRGRRKDQWRKHSVRSKICSDARNQRDPSKPLH